MSSECPYYIDNINEIWYCETDTYCVSGYGVTSLPV